WLMMSLWDALRMNMMISYQELVRTFPKSQHAVNDIKIVTLIKEEVIFHTLCGPHKAYFLTNHH
ncbi:hypothetical protein SBT60_03445, partial [Klebsiella pneumoniae]|uniref:hypothetical protein n=1 Tax=Klebsiella pneumoniae TaxID=573 RepID=UPI00298C5C4C